MKQTDSLIELSAFTQAAELRSYVAAGRVLGVSASAIGKSVMRLEDKLGVRLLHRSTRHISLTAEGELFYDRCLRILSEIEDAQAEVISMSSTPRGKLRVSLPVVAYRMLQPILPAFAARYPEVKLDLDFNDKLIDIIDEGMDVAIRSGDLTDSRLTARTLGSFRFHIVGSPAYFARHGLPLSPGDLQQHQCLHYKFPTTGKLQEWQITESDKRPWQVPADLICNNIEALIMSASLGLGLAYLPDFVVREQIKKADLQIVLNDYTQVQGVFSLLWPSSRYQSPKLRVFVDFVCSNIVLGNQ
ncbi:LysR family transcriptional regulator [Undibacterium sp. JH2W]|uniref:LysR family transcriptional regulator n=1 Tax=Undibacterium sp. JH2W TaxID=3413037 RepID=UPI003BF23763